MSINQPRTCLQFVPGKFGSRGGTEGPDPRGVVSFFLHKEAQAQHLTFTPPPPKKKDIRNFKHPKKYLKESLTVWALYAYFSDSQNAAFELLVWCM